MEQQRKYGLFTAITMIVGIVIGSGIFFKTDNILTATNGSVTLGIVVFCIAAFSIIFGSLTISYLAAMTDKPGGVVTYSEEFISRKFASGFGWFQLFVYFPSLTVVVSWVVGIYVSVLFNWNVTLLGQVLIGFAWFIICFAYNILSSKFGGWFQNFSTVAKMLPLLIVGVTGVIFGNPASSISTLSSNFGTSSSLGWVTAIGSIAFSFDGWIVSTSVAHEVRNSTKNLPKALIISPLIVLCSYLLYFVGISSYVGPEQIRALGDESVYFFATSLFGSLAAKVLIVFVVISVMGTVNGLVLGFIQLPYSLALRKMLPKSQKLTKINPKSDMPELSGIFALIVSIVWWVIHYFTMKFSILENSDVSEIAIVMSYLLYIVLYVQVIKFWRQGKIKGAVKGIVFPILAILGSLFILYGGLQNSLLIIFVTICLIAFAIGYFYKSKE